MPNLCSSNKERRERNERTDEKKGGVEKRRISNGRVEGRSIDCQLRLANHGPSCKSSGGDLL